MATRINHTARKAGSFGRLRWMGAVAAACAWLLAAAVGQVHAAQVTLAWDANTDPELAGYKVHYGTVSGTYGTTVDVGNVVSFTVTGLTEGATYYFAASAYDTVGNESGYSNEVPYTVPGIAEINLVGNSISITDGDTTPAAADHTDFGSADVAAGTVTRTFTIQNTGSGALTLSGSPLVVVVGANAADFSVSVQPAASVAAGATTTFQVTFDPGATGVRTATISIANNDANENPYDFAIQGAGTAAPEINLVGNGVSISDGDTTPAAADHTDFGSADTASGSVTRTFTIQNTGSGALTLSGSPLVVVTGANAADFSVTVQPAASVAAGATTTFQVTFDPGAAGVRTAAISIASNDANENPYDFAIQGTGTAPPAPDMSLLGNNTLISDGSTSPTITNDTDFDKTKLSGGTVTKTYTIRNDGAGPLVLSGSPLVVIGGANPADFVVSVPPAASVAPGASTTFVVTFDPSAEGTRNAVISITNNDVNKNAYDFAIKGRGIAPPKAPKNVRSNQ